MESLRDYLWCSSPFSTARERNGSEVLEVLEMARYADLLPWDSEITADVALVTRELLKAVRQHVRVREVHFGPDRRHVASQTVGRPDMRGRMAVGARSRGVVEHQLGVAKSAGTHAVLCAEHNRGRMDDRLGGHECSGLMTVAAEGLVAMTNPVTVDAVRPRSRMER